MSWFAMKYNRHYTILQIGTYAYDGSDTENDNIAALVMNSMTTFDTAGGTK